MEGIKRPKYLSPTAIGTWLSNQEEFFLKYMAIDRPPRIPQNQPMSVGSAFDAYVKAYLYARLFGPERAKQEGFDFQTLFEKQVEPHNRDWAIKAGAVCYQAYKASGAMSHLFGLLQKASTEPRFEFTAMGMAEDENGGIYNTVAAPAGCGSANQVVLMGKPDLGFKSKSNIGIILDWKVNGYCSKTKKQPVQGYMMLLDGYEPKSKNHGRIHKEAIPHEEDDGLHYSLYQNIEIHEPDWGRQLAIYSWLTGADVGSSIVVAIDQLCCAPSHPAPNISVAQHRCVLTESFQLTVYRQAQEIWDIIHSDHIFRHMSLVDSIQRCEVLLKQASAYKGDDAKTEFLRRMRR